MDGALDVADLLTVAVLAAGASFVLRVLLRPVVPKRVEPAPAARPVPVAGGTRPEGTVPVKPATPVPPGSSAPAPTAGRPRARVAEPVDTLLLGEGTQALAAARAAVDRHLLDLVQRGHRAEPPSRAACTAGVVPWPVARLVVVGSASRATRDAAVHHAATARVPLLLTADRPPA